MRVLDRFKQGEWRLTRVEAFSDGVFAIVVTLLVLELKMPAVKDHSCDRSPRPRHRHGPCDSTMLSFIRRAAIAKNA